MSGMKQALRKFFRIERSGVIVLALSGAAFFVYQSEQDRYRVSVPGMVTAASVAAPPQVARPAAPPEPPMVAYGEPAPWRPLPGSSEPLMRRNPANPAPWPDDFLVFHGQ